MGLFTTPDRPSRLPGANDPCWCGSKAKYKKCHRDEDTRLKAPPVASKRVKQGVVSPRLEVPAHIPVPDYVLDADGRPGDGIQGDPATRVERMRKACRAAAEVLIEGSAALAPGVTTDQIDRIVHAGYIKRGGYPSTLGYHGYPKSLCTSVNEVVVHGIPDSRALESGDIVNLDITIYLDGMHGDCSATFGVGPIDSESERLVRVTRECMLLGIEAIAPGKKLNVVGRAIETHAERHGFNVIRNYVGHGIGEVFHTPIQVPHYFDPRLDTVIEEGMFFTVEPMLCMGTLSTIDWNDNWTVVTADGRRSAQFEHTIYVTRDGAEILTKV